MPGIEVCVCVRAHARTRVHETEREEREGKERETGIKTSVTILKSTHLALTHWPEPNAGHQRECH